MNLSLNELDSLARRAARGAAYPWGLAEEAGKATRWLCANRLDGIGQLSRLLRCELATSLGDHTPVVVTGIWRARARLCPLLAGAHLSDSSNRWRHEEPVMHHVVAPLLLLPFVASAALANSTAYTLQCGDAVATTDGCRVAAASAFPDHAETCTVRSAGRMSACEEQQLRVIVDADELRVLKRYASKTYAPESEQSRLSGAGAGVSDND